MPGERVNNQKRNTGKHRKPAGKIQDKKKILFYSILGAACVIAIFAIIMIVKHASDNVIETEEENVIVTVEAPVETVLHLSFSQLAMFEADGFVSIDQFQQMLGTLYNKGYVLVDAYSLVDVDENGKFVPKETLEIPEGRKPLIISERDVSYPLYKQNSAFARRLVVDNKGRVRTEFADDAGNLSMGDYDIIPILDTFIETHPDFSYNGARGIIGLTGYNGILGYRTSSYLMEEGNPYGVFDVASETSAMEVVLKALKAEGWRFACNSFNNVSYGSQVSIVEEDVNKWVEQVGKLIGNTDMCIFARETDIGSWAPYESANQKYTLLSKAGFKYFMIDEKDTPGFLQVEDNYIRHAIYEVETEEDFQNAISINK